jgi:hypothetical protein
MKSKTMKYILICIGNYSQNQNEMIQNIGNEIMPMVSSPTVKYYNNDFNLIYHFESKVKFNDLKSLIDDAISPFVGMYFLSGCTPNMSLGMPQGLYDYLFNLDNNDLTPPDMTSICNVNQEIEVDEEFMKSVKEIQDIILSDMQQIESMDDFDDDCDNDLARIVRKSEKMEKVPTLDNLLDKIATKGISSLTKEEKELLEQYSK